MRKIIIIFFYSLLVNESFAQLNHTFIDIINKAFLTEKISNEVMIKDAQNFNSIYLNINDVVGESILNYDSIYKRLQLENGRTFSVSMDNDVKLFFFLEPMVLLTFTDEKVERVVVIDQFKIKDQSAFLKFHTTNLYNASHNKHPSQKTKFYKFKIDLSMVENKWKILAVEKKECQPKSIE